MRTTFLEYNPLSTETIEGLWNNAVFVFDTNVLLNLYRYSEDTSIQFLETIRKLREKDRIWLPHQVGLEFHENRLEVISDQKKLYECFLVKINDIIIEVEDKNRNPFLSNILFDKLLSIKMDINAEVENKIKLYDGSLKDDPILEKINFIFNGKVGDCFDVDAIARLNDEGERRYKDKIPPGYCDVKKPINERYGDLILWKQIILKAKNDELDIIYILDDRKEDWWLMHSGKTISPRPELLKEFRIGTTKNCHFYKPFQFLEYSNKYLGDTIKAEAIEEVKNYKPETIKNNNYIEINLTLQGKSTDLILLINEMKSAGYNIFTEFNNDTDLHEVCIFLPNIPDLERRLNTKYLSNLAEYNIKLIQSTKNT